VIQPVQIGEDLIGQGRPCFIIAEAGVNHNGDMDLAHRLIDRAAESGANAVKFQSFSAEKLVTSVAKKADYQVETTGKQDDSQYGMLKALELTTDQQVELKAHCEETGITYLCTPYENESVDMLDRMNVAAFKIASTDTTNIPFLRYLAEKKRSVILSTGMSTLGEVEQAINTLRTGGLEGKIVVLHCLAEYPAPINEVNLRAILTMQQAFRCPVGFSDHTPGVGASPWAVAIGACVVEKHFTLDRSLPGPDHRASLEPEELVNLVQTIRDVESALGDGIKRPMPSELSNKIYMRKSLVVRRDIRAGDKISADDLDCKRPGNGISPSWFDRVVGKRATSDLPKNSLLTLSSINWNE
jgi:N,N'-diacetyllegionaminate synthase